QMMAEMARDLGQDPETFAGYGSELTLAEYYRIRKGHFDDFVAWMDREWHANGIKVAHSRLHTLIAQAQVDRIYTTNYDRWIERAFDHHGRPYHKVVDVDDLARAPAGVTQIVKLHG